MDFQLLYLVLLANALFLNAANYSLKIITGPEINNFQALVTDLRLSSYREYPYLYEGSLEEERAYFTWFAEKRHTALVVAFYNQKPIGFLSGTALIDFNEHLQGSMVAFKNAKLNPEHYYYFADVIIHPDHRGHGLSKKFFSLLERWAQDRGYKSGCFITESHEHHPLMPANYKDLGVLWKRLGYLKSNFFVTFTWPTVTIDGAKDCEHQLDFWLKDF